MKKYLFELWEESDGVGVVEVILILVILIGLVLLFKGKIEKIVKDALKSISDNGDKITGASK